MFKKIIQKFIAKLYHYILAIDRRMYGCYIADKQVFNDTRGGVNLRGKIHLYSKKISVGEGVSFGQMYISQEKILQLGIMYRLDMVQ